MMGKMHFVALIFLLCLIDGLNGFAIANKKNEDFEEHFPVGTNRTGKFFYPFGTGLVSFENGVCTTAEGFQGTCLTRRICRRESGVGSTTCALTIGICCVLQRTCGASSAYNNTYFVSPNYPNPYLTTSTCSFTINKYSDDMCQARIDFATLVLAQPNANGSCINDALYVIGGSFPIPVICGDMSGQHIYVDFNGDTDIEIVIYTGATSTIGRLWNIKISQIACECPWKAPTGCLQYYTAASGTIQSFNYGITSSINGTRQLVNENYGVCVSMQPGYCGISYSQCSGLFSFTLTGDTNIALGNNANGLPGAIATAGAAVTGSNCTTDFIVIPHPAYSNGTNLVYDRFCGNGIFTVQTQSKPFVLTVVTNSNEDGDLGNRGFCLSYTQQRCLGVLG